MRSIETKILLIMEWCFLGMEIIVSIIFRDIAFTNVFFIGVLIFGAAAIISQRIDNISQKIINPHNEYR